MNSAPQSIQQEGYIRTYVTKTLYSCLSCTLNT